MARKRRGDILRVLKAISSEARLAILRTLYKERLMSFTDICNALRSEAEIESSKVAYHLTKLKELNLITIDESTGKYRLTERGLRAVKVAMELAEYLEGEEKLSVRDRNLIIGDFDRNLLVSYLKGRLGIPLPQAFSLSKLIEERVRSMDLNLVDSEYIRYLIGVVLYERGLKEYERHFRKLGLSYASLRELIDEVFSEGRRFPLVELGFRLCYDFMKQYPYLSGVLDGEALRHYGKGRLFISNLSYLGLLPESIVVNVEMWDTFCERSSDILMKLYEISLLASQYSSSSHLICGFDVVLNSLSEKYSSGELLISLKHYFYLLSTSPSLERTGYVTALLINFEDATLSEPVSLALRALIELAEEDLVTLPVLILKIDRSLKPLKPIREVLGEAIGKGVPIFFVNETEVKGPITAHLQEMPASEDSSAQLVGSTFSLNVLRAISISRERHFMETLMESLRCGLKALKVVKERLAKGALPLVSRVLGRNSKGSKPPLYSFITALGLEEASRRLTHIDDERLKLMRDILETIQDEITSDDVIFCSITPDPRVYDYVVKFSGELEEAKVINPFSLVPLSRPIRLKERAYMETSFQELMGSFFLNVHLTHPLPTPKELWDVMRHLLTERGLKALTFTVDITRCLRCGFSVYSLLNKCPRCSSGGSYIDYYGKVIARYEALKLLGSGARVEYFSRVRYSSPLLF